VSRTARRGAKFGEMLKFAFFTVFDIILENKSIISRLSTIIW